jgi:hypothetical protein
MSVLRRFVGGVWVPVVIGEQGPQGIQGEKGDKGDTGDAGLGVPTPIGSEGQAIVVSGGIATWGDVSPLYFVENVVDPGSGVYVPQLSDIAKVIAVTSSSDVSVEMPDDFSVNFPIGTVINVYRAGTGQVFVGSGSAVVRNEGFIADQYVEVSLRKRGPSEWVLSGAVF